MRSWSAGWSREGAPRAWGSTWRRGSLARAGSVGSSASQLPAQSNLPAREREAARARFRPAQRPLLPIPAHRLAESGSSSGIHETRTSQRSALGRVLSAKPGRPWPRLSALRGGPPGAPRRRTRAPLLRSDWMRWIAPCRAIHRGQPRNGGFEETPSAALVASAGPSAARVPKSCLCRDLRMPSSTAGQRGSRLRAERAAGLVELSSRPRRPTGRKSGGGLASSRASSPEIRAGGYPWRVIFPCWRAREGNDHPRGRGALRRFTDLVPDPHSTPTVQRSCDPSCS